MYLQQNDFDKSGQTVSRGETRIRLKDIIVPFIPHFLQREIWLAELVAQQGNTALGD